MKSFSKKILIVVVMSIVLISCKAGKRQPCRTCPKWEDSIQLTAQPHYEEQYQP